MAPFLKHITNTNKIVFMQKWKNNAKGTALFLHKLFYFTRTWKKLQVLMHLGVAKDAIWLRWFLWCKLYYPCALLPPWEWLCHTKKGKHEEAKGLTKCHLEQSIPLKTEPLRW